MQKHTPPIYATKLLKSFCDRYWQNEVLGDLEEQFKDNYINKGRHKAKWIYWLEVLGFVRPHLFSQKVNETSIIMLFNHIKIAFRSLVKSKAYTSANILGLSVGISSVLLISLYVLSEVSYDKFFKDSDRTYRIPLERVYPDRTKFFATSPVNLATVLKENYTEVEEATRFHKLFFSDIVSVKIAEETYHERDYRYADADFFKVFSHEFLHGNPTTALDAPNKVVLTKSIALKYFNDENALNKTFLIDTVLFTISGVIEDVPENSHMPFDVLGSIHQLPFLEQAIENNSWISPWLFTYVKLKEGTDAALFEEQLANVVEIYGKGNISQRLGSDYAANGHKFNYFMQRLPDIHLHSNLDVEMTPNSDIRYIYMLEIIAAIILFICTINFVNLTTAQSTERAKEVGIRKVMGSLRSTLINQFITEAMLISLISAMVALVLVYLLLPFFNELLNKSLTITTLMNPSLALSFILFALLVGLLSGLYPAIAISSMSPSRILKGTYKTSKSGVWLRNILIGLQFFISIIMISGAILVHNQMTYFTDKPLGFEKDNIMVIRLTQPLETNFQLLKNELLNIEKVTDVGGAFGLPGDFLGSSVYQSISNPELSDFRANVGTFGDDFTNAMKFEISEGRSFSKNYNDSLSILLNESAVKSLGIKDPIGSKISAVFADSVANPEFTVIGIIKDYHFRSLHSEISPVVIFNANQNFTPPTIVIRTNTEDLASVIEQIENKWTEHSGQDFDFSFLDESLDAQYKSDISTGRLFDVFTIIAVMMSCVGLFGFATYIAEQRTKEMSIRKVLGASSMNVVLTFSNTFLKLILLSFLLGIPFTYIVVNKWLNTFAYHIDISWPPFIIAGTSILALIFITVSYHSVKLVLMNPSETLRKE